MNSNELIELDSLKQKNSIPNHWTSHEKKMKRFFISLLTLRGKIRQYNSQDKIKQVIRIWNKTKTFLSLHLTRDTTSSNVNIFVKSCQKKESIFVSMQVRYMYSQDESWLIVVQILLSSHYRREC